MVLGSHAFSCMQANTQIIWGAHSLKGCMLEL